MTASKMCPSMDEFNSLKDSVTFQGTTESVSFAHWPDSTTCVIYFNSVSGQHNYSLIIDSGSLMLYDETSQQILKTWT